MKIVKIVKGKSKLLDLITFKTKESHLKKNHFNYLLKKDVEMKFKNALNIIFKFHSNNKKILFLGTPLNLNKRLKKLFKNTNHSFIPEKIWLNGVLTNTKSIFKFLFKKYFKKNKNNLKFLFNLTSKNNLVVILNESLSTNPFKEFSKKRIPTISLNYSNINLNCSNSTYRIKQNINNNENKITNNLFFSILTTTLKKAEKVRKKNIEFNLKQRIARKKNIEFNLKKRKVRQKNKKIVKKNAFFKKK